MLLRQVHIIELLFRLTHRHLTHQLGNIVGRKVNEIGVRYVQSLAAVAENAKSFSRKNTWTKRFTAELETQVEQDKNSKRLVLTVFFLSYVSKINDASCAKFLFPVYTLKAITFPHVPMQLSNWERPLKFSHISNLSVKRARHKSWQIATAFTLRVVFVVTFSCPKANYRLPQSHRSIVVTKHFSKIPSCHLQNCICQTSSSI